MSSMAISRVLLADQDLAMMIEHLINAFPKGRPLIIGALSVCPDNSDLERLGPDALINDEVLRCVLGIKYEKLYKSQ